MIESLQETDILLTQKGTLRKRKPKQSIQYFTQETEDAIIEYLLNDNKSERNKIFNEKKIRNNSTSSRLF